LGIYGFLTAAFQETFNVYNVSSKQKAFLEQKEKFWGDDVARYDRELESINQRIEQLSNAKSQQIQVRDTTVASGFRTTVSTRELRLAQERLGVEEESRKDIQSKRQTAADSLQSIQLQILDLETDTDVSAELGPLQYLSGLLDKPMDQIINWFILIIIFVFDPLAVALVVAFNNALKIDKGETDKKKVVQKRELYGEEIEPDPNDLPSLWDDTINDGLEDEEWDEDHALDQVLNDMVEDIEVKDAEEITTNEEFIKTLDEIEKKQNKNIDEELLNLKPDTNRRGIDLDGDGTIDGFDNNGDGLIDEPVPVSSRRAQYVMNTKPYYARKGFDWNDKSKWINDQNAVNYWIKYVKPNKYPDDFSSKTY
jgi:hypothetical protein